MRASIIIVAVLLLAGCRSVERLEIKYADVSIGVTLNQGD